MANSIVDKPKKGHQQKAGETISRIKANALKKSRQAAKEMSGPATPSRFAPSREDMATPTPINRSPQAMDAKRFEAAETLKRQVRDKRMATGINPNIMNQTQPEGLRNAISKENSYDPNRHNGSFKFKVRQGAHAKNYKAGK